MLFPSRAIFVLITLFIAATAIAETSTFDIAPFGSVTIYRPPKTPTAVIVFASGTEGWKGPATEIAKSLATGDHLVIGFDLNAYLKGVSDRRQMCPAGDLEMLGKEVERRLKFPEFFFPVLAGYAEGGSLIYVALVEAPTNFLGGVSLGFCPSLPISGRLCPGWGFHDKPSADAKSVRLLPAKDLRYPWFVLEGTEAASCKAKTFIDGISHAEYVQTDSKNVTVDLNSAIDRILKTLATPPPNSGLANLPIVELKGNGSGDSLMILISGDGGWVSLDREIGNYLEEQGISVIGLDSLRYFWTGRTPKEAAKDIKRIVAYYLPRWNKKKVILAGYSMGADVLPFIVKRMRAEDLKEISGLALIGPSSKVDFQTGPLMGEEQDKERQLFPTLKKIATTRLLCIGGLLERPPSLCKRLQEDKSMSDRMDIEFLPSGHMFAMDPKPISDLLIAKFHL
jgi:type IV secretory pathway VirJ component